ncbi:MAG TPA: hypothetical protein VFU11_04320 [Solirubrobacterales bacterium]|nr:hypothetical protein [Solirubrobacterales bacterium]
MRKLAIAAACVGVLWGTAGAGAAEARLDPGFGQGGVVKVQPPLPSPWQNQYIRQMAAARDGNSYVLFQRMYCAGQAGCPTSDVVFHYLPDGSLDTSFGSGGSYELPPEGEGVPTLAVDSAGRPLIAKASETTVVIRRLTAEGAPDPSFGEEGATTLHCICGYNLTRLIPGPGGSVTVALPRVRYIGNERSGSVLTLIRLGANGAPAARFGRGGALSFAMPGAGVFVTSAVARRGAIYLAGAACCSSDSSPYLVRVSARGKVDRRFTRTAGRVLRLIARLEPFQAGVRGVLVRPRGKIDVLGYGSFGRGFQMRLRPNGRSVRSFGKDGLLELPLPVVSAALGSEGAVIALGGESLRYRSFLFRVLRGGRLDRGFGRELVPENSETGMTVVAQAGRKALVLDLGLHECRGYCPATPQLVRYLE